MEFAESGNYWGSTFWKGLEKDPGMDYCIYDAALLYEISEKSLLICRLRMLSTLSILRVEK